MDLQTFARMAEAIAPDVIANRRRFHANPELFWKERETRLFIEKSLREMNFENIRVGFGRGDTGVTADLNSHLLE